MDDDESLALADVLRWARYARKRDRRGADWCLAEGFGAERRELDKLSSGAIPINATDRQIARTQERGRVHLTAVCRSCPLQCEMAG